MSSLIAIFERLLNDEATNFKEHVLETASPSIANVQERLEQSFEKVVHEISTIWGDPSYAGRIQGKEEKVESEGSPAEKRKKLTNVIPPWCKGIARSGGDPVALRVTYWKRPDNISYIVLRTEVDPQRNNKPLHYDVVLGTRRRNKEPGRESAKLRQNREHPGTQLMTFLRKFFTGS